MVTPELEARPQRKRSCLSVTAPYIGVGLLLMLGAAILLPNFIRSGTQGKLTACKSNLKNIGTALEMYSTDFAGAYPRSVSLLTPNYLKTMPHCPNVGEMTYRVSFGAKAPMNTGTYEDYYYVDCTGENHAEVGVLGDFPAYNGITGLVERDPGPTKAK